MRDSLAMLPDPRPVLCLAWWCWVIVAKSFSIDEEAGARMTRLVDGFKLRFGVGLCQVDAVGGAYTRGVVCHRGVCVKANNKMNK